LLSIEFVDFVGCFCTVFGKSWKMLDSGVSIPAPGTKTASKEAVFLVL
jgi:hypothetical protein